jgi:hypothetical protein
MSPSRAMPRAASSVATWGGEGVRHSCCVISQGGHHVNTLFVVTLSLLLPNISKPLLSCAPFLSAR